MFGLGALGTAILLGAGLLFSALKVMREYERGVILRLGRLTDTRGPGLIFVIPGVERLYKVDLRTITFDVPSGKPAGILVAPSY
jgi:regulator of protease activity HflC (stomatin/prohibitin superfamily)